MEFCQIVLFRGGAATYQKKKKIFFAPMYWMGWRSRLIMQGHGVPTYCTLIDPNKY
jgi:hypothetical protein